ncbi:MAG: tetratricopeptide repeat protein [Verrucomicrobiota bacterium]
MKQFLLLLLFAPAVAVSALAEELGLETAFSSANAAYISGDYSAALAEYEALMQQGQSTALLYNLGNAYAQLGQPGQAILAYERALVLAPENPDILANLSYVREGAQAEPPGRSWNESAAQTLSLSTWTLFTVVGFWAGLGLFILAPLYRWRSPWRSLLLGLSVLAVGAGLLGLLGYHQLSKEGVVLQADAPLKLAPTQNSPASTFLQAGTTADLKRQKGNYAYVETQAGEQGWLSLDDYATVWPN